ncbi:hypothetical protein ACHQM5_018593 [Ranunculus cassubicifolius]
MALKIDQASSIEPRPPQITINASPKVSKFGMKTGFVIPKNKLSGSLVPVYRGTAKTETDTVKEETAKQNQRKTKWGTDLTQDATVRKGRALAYQTRVEQITKQLKAGVLEKEDEDNSSPSPDAARKDKSSIHQDDDQELEMLEFEKREVIGEILKLNPSFKAPLDYKPLMKETSIPVPVKLYPSLNFVSLILGPANNTQKRLEEETGAKIRIKGTKAGSAEKVEITSSDKNDVPVTYEELHVHVSADTFEKVDSAVSLIELLVTPVSANSVTVSAAPSTDSLNGPEQSQPNQGVMQPMARPMQPSFIPQGQFHPYPTPSPTPTQAPWFQPGANPMRPHNNFVPQPNTQFPNNVGPFPSSPQNPSMPQFYNGPRNPPQGSPRLHPPPQNYQWPPQNSQGPPPRMHPMSGPPQPQLTYPGPPFHGQPNNPSMTHQNTNNQPRTTGPGPGQGPGFFPSSQPYPTPIGNNNMNSTPNFPPRPSNHTVTNPNFSFVIHQRSPLPPNPVQQPPPVVSPATATPPLPRPSSGDFTFQPLGSPLAVPRPNNQPSQAPPLQPPPPPQTPPFRPPRPQFGPPQPPNSGLPFPGNQHLNRPPQRFQEFANQAGPPPPRLQPPTPQLPPQMANFHGRYPPQMMNPPPQLQLQHNQSGQMMRPGGGGFSVPNQQYGNNPTFSTGRPILSPSGNQVYDPFSPTSANPAKVRKQEDDPEYDDLMASVGVR